MKRLFYIFLALLICCSGEKVMSQEDFAPGFIINEQNDTIRGLLDQKNFQANSRQCTFKASADAAQVNYTPEEIKGYQYTNGKYYVARTIPEFRDSSRVFLEYLVEGIADLFYIRESDKDRYFIQKPGKGLIELTIEEKELMLNGKKVIKTNNAYKGVLRYTFSDDMKLFDKIDKTSLSPKDLVKITKEYHNDVCNDYSCIDYTKDLSSNFSYGPEAGVIISWMTMQTSSDYDRNIRPVYGIRFSVNPPFLSKNWSLETGISNSGNDFDRIYNTDLANGNIYFENIDYRIKISYDALRIPLLIKYTLPFKKVKPFLICGTDGTLLLSKTFEAYRYYNYGTEFFKSLPVESRLTNLQLGLIGATGINFSLNERSTMDIRLAYERRAPGSNFRNLMDYQVIHSLELTFGMKFKINK